MPRSASESTVTQTASRRHGGSPLGQNNRGLKTIVTMIAAGPQAAADRSRSRIDSFIRAVAWNKRALAGHSIIVCGARSERHRPASRGRGRCAQSRPALLVSSSSRMTGFIRRRPRCENNDERPIRPAGECCEMSAFTGSIETGWDFQASFLDPSDELLSTESLFGY